MLVKTSKGWFDVKFKLRGLADSGFESREERDILRAAFKVQVKHGSLLCDPSSPEDAGYGSAPILCGAAKWDQNRRNWSRAGSALRRAERKGFCAVHKRAKDGLRNGANRIILSFRCFRLSPYVSQSEGRSGPLNLIWLSSLSSSDFVNSEVQDHEASRQNWSEGLSAFRDRSRWGGGS